MHKSRLGVVVIDCDGLIQETNPAAESVLGEGLAGKSWQEVAGLVFPDQAPVSGEWLTEDGRRVSILSSSLEAEKARILLLTDVTDR